MLWRADVLEMETACRVWDLRIDGRTPRINIVWHPNTTTADLDAAMTIIHSIHIGP